MSPSNAVLPPAIAPHRFSPSALDRYRTCPRSYYYADIERAPRCPERQRFSISGLAVREDVGF